MTTARHSTAWFDLLDDFVRVHQSAPFAWGVNDCCTFAANWIMVVRRGADPMADLRAFAESLELLDPRAAAVSAARWLDQHGGLLAAVTMRLGEPLAGPMAQAGDVALVQHGAGWHSMGVCVGHHVVAPGLDGLQRVPLSAALAAWRV